MENCQNQIVGLLALPPSLAGIGETHLFLTSHSVGPACSDTVHTNVQSPLISPHPKLLHRQPFFPLMWL